MAGIMEKVTAFVTRGRGASAQLLLFRHPTAGIQLPAGTVEAGETPEIAVLREVREETGLQNVTIRTRLGEHEQALPADRRWVLRPTKLFDEPAFDAGSRGTVLFRGTQVTLLASHGPFALVRFAEYQRQGERETLLFQVNGYVRQSLLSRRARRTFFHLLPTSATDDAWTIDADGHMFACFWQFLTSPPELVPEQSPWLDACYDQLLRACAA